MTTKYQMYNYSSSSNKQTYKFRTPSNQLITIDDKYAYKDIRTIADLKDLFSLKNRLYSLEMFEIGHNDNILDLHTNLSDLNVDEYNIIHIIKNTGPAFIEEDIISEPVQNQVSEQIMLKTEVIPELVQNQVIVSKSYRCLIC